ncbi:DUF3306 domain-containing protein [Motiliproteus coralliicola]|uniref:DUF3306 domain-containing protein n=1 Tax=Motiliproteus coralliicola TaxID=2283196 RepID=UPI001403C5D8|nr:DUF3306 domain-containing protein [Motiliproteus coralliicola]
MAEHTKDSTDEGFLGRWSRLKQQPQSQTQVEPEQSTTELASSNVADVAEVDNDEQAIGVEQPPLTDADMPSLESLDESSDFSGFLSEGVSEKLRRQALRKLFHLPEFNIRDGLNEYDEDYSTFIPLGDTVTYQMKQWAEKQKQDFEAALVDGDSEASTAPSTMASEAEPESDLNDSGQDCGADDEEELGECEE